MNLKVPTKIFRTLVIFTMIFATSCEKESQSEKDEKAILILPPTSLTIPPPPALAEEEEPSTLAFKPVDGGFHATGMQQIFRVVGTVKPASLKDEARPRKKENLFWHIK